MGLRRNLVPGSVIVALRDADVLCAFGLISSAPGSRQNSLHTWALAHRSPIVRFSKRQEHL